MAAATEASGHRRLPTGRTVPRRAERTDGATLSRVCGILYMCPMTGRLTQLGRQLRKLRHIVGGSPEAVPKTTPRRATQLARDLACEHTEIKDPEAAFRELAGRGILEPALAARLAGYAAASAQREDTIGGDAITAGGDLDRFLRSLEAGAPAPVLPFEGIVPRERAKPDSTAAVVISGRVLDLDVRRGRAAIAIDDRPITMTLASGDVASSFALAEAPSSRAEVHRDPTGKTRVAWTQEHLVLEIAPDFARVQVL